MITIVQALPSLGSPKVPCENCVPEFIRAKEKEIISIGTYKVTSNCQDEEIWNYDCVMVAYFKWRCKLGHRRSAMRCSGPRTSSNSCSCDVTPYFLIAIVFFRCFVPKFSFVAVEENDYEVEQLVIE